MENKNHEIGQNQCDNALMYPREIVLKEDSHTEKVAQHYTRERENNLNQYRTKQWPKPQIIKGNKV